MLEGEGGGEGGEEDGEPRYDILELISRMKKK
jgi:hypothetical protein